jgi:hypothetical protein
MKINKILQISSCRIVNTNSSANGTIDVKFSAQVFILNAWDILVGVEIDGVKTIISANYKRGLNLTIGFVPTNISANVLQLKQLVPVRVVKAQHRPMNSIAAAVLLLTCEKKYIIYKTKGKLNITPELSDILTNIKEELIKRAELFKTKPFEVNFFEKLLYTYKSKYDVTINTKIKTKNNNIVWDGPEQVINDDNKLINILDLEHNQDITGYWFRPLHLYRSSPVVSFSKEKQDGDNISRYDTTPTPMIIEIAKNILSFLVAIRECVEIYNTDELIKSHENVWTLMKNSQIDI